MFYVLNHKLELIPWKSAMGKYRKATLQNDSPKINPLSGLSTIAPLFPLCKVNIKPGWQAA